MRNWVPVRSGVTDSPNRFRTPMRVLPHRAMCPAIFLTPHIAIFAVLLLAVLLALSGSLVILAQATSALILTVFCIMNLSLLKIKIGGGGEKAAFSVPWPVPAAGFAASAALTFFIEPRAFGIVLVLVLIGCVLHVVSTTGRRGT